MSRRNARSAILLIFFICALFISSVQSLHDHRNINHERLHSIPHPRADYDAFPTAFRNKQVRTRNLTQSEAVANNSIDQWIAANPDAASKIPAAQIEAFKQDLANRRNGVHTVNKVVTHPHVHKRQNVTQIDLQNARAIVEAAQDDAGRKNNLVRASPRLNNYSFQNATTRLKTRSTDSPAVNSTVASAAAIVAEADIALFATNGTLHTSYVLPGGFKSPPGHEHEGGNAARSSEKLQKRDDSFWMETVGSEYAGSSPLDTSSSNYVVWRNVKDYGAVGDGTTDDTAAINKAISDGGRCGEGCGSTSVKGAVIYFPAGTYMVSTPIIAYYNTQLIGNPNNLPVILAAPGFIGLGVISSDVYLASGEWYINQSNFYRSIRNFIINLRSTNTYAVAGIHWQVAQATSLQNIYFWMNSDNSKAQVGIFAENGSGGFMSDLVFYGGSIGLQCGNQQFTTRNFVFVQCTVGISLLWDWGWTFKSVNLYQCPTGIQIAGDTVGGSVYLLDSIITGASVTGIDMPASNGDTLTSNYLNLDNVEFSGTPSAISQGGTKYLGAGDTTINSYVYGRIYDVDNPNGKFSHGVALDNPHPMTESLGGGPQSGYFERSKPQYETLAADAFINAKRWASGNGQHDDTNALNMAFSVAASEGLAVYIPAGIYLVTDTVYIPSGSVIVGECWSQIMASGSKFQDINTPHVMVRVGVEGEVGTVEIQDILFTVKGATAGAVLVEWNISPSAKGAAAMWDSHFRVGGAVGTDLSNANCPKLTGSINPKCIAASLLLHLTSSGSAYLENMWAWVADHDLDDNAATQIDIYSARGILIESLGPSWLYGTASEHSVLYQYQLHSAENIFMSMIQTESPYYPPTPNAPAPFTDVVGAYDSDPDIAGGCDGITDDGCFVSWALSIQQSTNIQIGGAGLYSWFVNYDEDCVNTSNCQLRLVSIGGNTNLYMLNLYTVGAVQMIVPTGSSLNTAIAKDNTNQNAYPWLAVIAAWTDLVDDDAEFPLCDWDDDRAICLADSDNPCDLSLKFTSMDALVAATGIPSYCMDIYIMQVVSDMLPIAMANYSSVDNNYDNLFNYYVEYINDLVPVQINAFMAKGAPGNKYFECVYNNGDKNSTAAPCPLTVNELETFYTIYYVPTDLDGFWAELSSTYGIDQSWAKLGRTVDAYSCASQRCEAYSHAKEGFPMPADSYTVPNPKEIIAAALPNITALAATIQATRMDVLLGQWSGSQDDVVQVVSTPVFMIQQAIDSMATVKALGKAQEDEDKKNLILKILSIVFISIPFVGEALGVLGDVAAQLIRMIDLIGAAGNEALSIVDVVSSGGSAPMAILGVLLGVTDFRNPTSFGKMATARRDMSVDDVSKVGALFKVNSDKLDTIAKSCK